MFSSGLERVALYQNHVAVISQGMPMGQAFCSADAQGAVHFPWLKQISASLPHRSLLSSLPQQQDQNPMYLSEPFPFLPEPYFLSHLNSDPVNKPFTLLVCNEESFLPFFFSYATARYEHQEFQMAYQKLIQWLYLYFNTANNKLQ